MRELSRHRLASVSTSTLGKKSSLSVWNVTTGKLEWSVVVASANSFSGIISLGSNDRIMVTGSSEDSHVYVFDSLVGTLNYTLRVPLESSDFLVSLEDVLFAVACLLQCLD